MSDIPAARERVERLDRQAADLLARAEQMMWRDKPGKPRAPIEAKKITPRLKAEILAYARRNPKASVKQMAVRFDTGIGRVSEVINGKR